MKPYNTESAEHRGHTITVSWHYDQDTEAPWEHCDGHGPVSGWERRDKRPGELILHEDRGSKRFYDFAEAVKIARRDGWDAKPYGGTSGERAHRAAMADFEWLRAWCKDEWHWAGYTVEIDGEPSYSESLWGIGSQSEDQFTADAFKAAKDWLDNELTERESAACRDIVTA